MKTKSLNDFTKEELIELNQYLLQKIEERDHKIKELKESEYSPYQLGTPRSATFTRPRPPVSPRRRGNSLPNSLNTSPLQSNFLPSPPIQEEDYNDIDETNQEFFYETLITELEKDKKKLNKEVNNLHLETNRLEQDKALLQTQNEQKDKELALQKTKNLKLLQNSELLVKENQKLQNDLRLTGEDFLERSGAVDKLQKELSEEKQYSQSLEEQLSSEREESQKTTQQFNQLLKQINKLNNDKTLLLQDKEELKQVIEASQKEYQNK
jgi:hypothetical protein